MTEQNQVPPDGEDRVLDQQLHTLERFTPIIGFESRVLSKVWRPAPMFWLVFKDRLREFASPRRRWLAAGLASLGSIVSALMLSSLLVEPWLVEQGGLARVQAWAANAVSATTWDAMQDAAFTGMQTAARYVTSIPAASISQWAGVAMGVILAPVISLVGLCITMRRPVSERGRSYASR